MLLANKLARIVWAVLARGGNGEMTRSHDLSLRRARRRQRPKTGQDKPPLRAGLDRACARRSRQWAGRAKERRPARTRELDDEALTTEGPAGTCQHACS
jgi:hypothetical protein